MREISRRRPNLRNRIATDLEEASVALAIDEPAWGQHRVANELAKQGADDFGGRRAVCAAPPRSRDG